MTYDRFVELTELVTVVGDQWDKKRSYKFPLVACELLVSDNSKIDEYFLPQDGVVVVQEKVIHSVEKQVEQEVDDDEEQKEDEKEDKKKQEGEKTEEEGEEKAKEKNESEDEQFSDFVTAP